MAQRDGKRIGYIRGSGFADGEQHLHHVGDLRLVGSASADHGELDGPRCVLIHRSALRYRSGQRRAARLPELQGTVGIAMHEHPFDGDLVRRVLGNDCQHLFVDMAQLRSQICTRNAHAATGDMCFANGLAVDQAESHSNGAGVQTKHTTRQRCHRAGRANNHGIRIERSPIAAGIAWHLNMIA
jgi:hypothetical protein